MHRDGKMHPSKKRRQEPVGLDQAAGAGQVGGQSGEEAGVTQERCRLESKEVTPYCARPGSHWASPWTEAPSAQVVMVASCARGGSVPAPAPCLGPASAPAIPTLEVDQGSVSAIGVEYLTLDRIPGTKMGAGGGSAENVSPWNSLRLCGAGDAGPGEVRTYNPSHATLRTACKPSKASALAHKYEGSVPQARHPCPRE